MQKNRRRTGFSTVLVLSLGLAGIPGRARGFEVAPAARARGAAVAQTVTGVVFTAVGLPLLGTGIWALTPQSDCGCGLLAALVGLPTVVIGTAHLLVGIPLVTVGGGRWARLPAPDRLEPLPTGAGPLLGLRVRF